MGSYIRFEGSNPNARRINLFAGAPDGVGAISYMDNRSQNGGNFQQDIYAQNDDGSIWGELYNTNGSLYIAHTAEIDIETGSQDIVLKLIEGTGIYTEVQAGQTYQIEGVVQDDTATMVAALDSGNNLVWVDKSTIVNTLPGTSNTYADYDSVNVANDGSPNTGWSVPVEAGKNYTIEAYLVPIVSSGVGYNMTFVLPGSSTFFRAMYEFSAPASGGEVNTNNIKRENAATLGTFNMPNASFNVLGGSPAVKVLGHIQGNDTTGNIQLTIALDGAGPETGNMSGWIKVTEIP